MIIRIGIVLTLLVWVAGAHAQTRSADTIMATGAPDTVTVSAFNLHTRWRETPAAIAIINRQTLERLGQVSLVPALNTIAGVRMEERSPGSYRLSVRGSLLRSPFGIRNLKMYWDDIPFTDAGGNSYFNLVDYSQLQSAEIIKGPAASMYGANTGGAVLLHSVDALPRESGVGNWELGVGGGAYGMFRQHAGYRYADTTASIQIRQLHQQRDGFRQQSALRKDGVQVNSRLRLNSRQQLSLLAFYTDLYYQTPGGITAQQAEQDPTLARQKTATLPGAVEQQTAIYNKTAFGGLSLRSQLGTHWQNTTSVTLNHTDFSNPFITNYEKRDEWNYGGRTVFRYRNNGAVIQWNATAGVEWQQQQSKVDNYGNRAGRADTVQFKDRLRATQSFAFAQADLRVYRWLFQAGVSRNLLNYHYQRVTDTSPEQAKKQDAVWAPRFSVLYRLSDQVSLYAIAARGFSPPSLAEVRPSDGNYYGDLQPEQGWNYEAGIKGEVWQNRIRFDINAYDFRLREAIVRRTNAAGAEYFINAGGTVQQGIECFVQARLLPALTVYHSFSFQPYRFTDYQVAGADYSGNRITGVPRTIHVTGVNLELPRGWYANIVLNNTSSVTLNDGATELAKAYHLLQARVGYSWKIGAWRAELFAAADNLLNERYSLGNDLNAMGNRYYNPAAARNFSGGMLLRL